MECMNTLSALCGQGIDHSAEEKCVTTKLFLNMQLSSRQENSISSAMRVDKLCFNFANVNGINGTICHIFFVSISLSLSLIHFVHQDIVSLQRRLNVKRYEMRNELSFHLLLLCLVRLLCARAHRPCPTTQRFYMQQRQKIYIFSSSVIIQLIHDIEYGSQISSHVFTSWLFFFCFDFIKKSGKIRCPA